MSFCECIDVRGYIRENILYILSHVNIYIYIHTHVVRGTNSPFVGVLLGVTGDCLLGIYPKILVTVSGLAVAMTRLPAAMLCWG